MCITAVPSAWNAEAMAIPRRPDASSAHSSIVARMHSLEPVY